MDHFLDAVVLSPPGTHAASVIWLHGLGADGHDFEPMVPQLDLPAEHGIRFVFPNAPKRPVTINAGLVMPAWYDVRHADLRGGEDADGIVESAGSIEQLIQVETNRGIDAGKIALAGFSQGGAVALHCGLRHSEKLAGILALSTYLPLPERLASEASTANRGTPIFMAHGLFDPIVPIHQSRDSCAQLRSAGYEVEWHDYPMPHGVCPQEIADIGAWLKVRLMD